MKKKERLSIVIPTAFKPSTDRALRRIADEKELPKSIIIRMAVMEFIGKNSKPLAAGEAGGAE